MCCIITYLGSCTVIGVEDLVYDINGQPEIESAVEKSMNPVRSFVKSVCEVKPPSPKPAIGKFSRSIGADSILATWTSSDLLSSLRLFLGRPIGFWGE